MKENILFTKDAPVANSMYTADGLADNTIGKPMSRKDFHGYKHKFRLGAAKRLELKETKVDDKRTKKSTRLPRPFSEGSTQHRTGMQMRRVELFTTKEGIAHLAMGALVTSGLAFGAVNVLGGGNNSPETPAGAPSTISHQIGSVSINGGERVPAPAPTDIPAPAK